ncbi:MAG: T7SS effector LXG polymorphic toxin [Eubacterium sp.]
MAYKKIYYDDIWEITSKSSQLCDAWSGNLSDLNNKLLAFQGANKLKGQAADNMKNYMNQVHGMLIPILGSIVQTYAAKARSYYSGYINSVDSGDGSNYGVRYTTIVYGEVNNSNGSIKRELDAIKSMVDQVTRDANSVKYSVSNLVNISAYPKNSNLNTQLNSAINKAKNVHDKTIAFESGRANDFAEIDRLIAQARSIINSQLGKSRIPIISYKNGDIASMCDINSILVDLEATSNIVKAFQESDEYEEAVNLSLNRDAMIQEEEEASREWIQWVAVGVAVVGAVALTVVTAGGASPLVCAAVGAGVGLATAATSSFADNYIKNGDLFEGMDWSEFGKDALIGTVVGGISGYLGAVSQGSAIKQPIDKAMMSFSNSALKEGAEGVLNIGWDFGDAIISGKPGDEIISILQSDTNDMLRDIVVDGATSFVGGYISGKFDVDTSDKGYFQKLGEKTVENAATSVTEGGLNTIWDIGECVLDPNSSKNIESIFKDRAKETVSGFIGATTGSAISEGFTGTKDIKNPIGKVTAQTIKDTTADTVENISKGVTSRTMEYIYGEEKDASKIVGDIWDKDLDDGRNIAKSASKSAGKNISNEVYKDKKIYNDLNKIDRDHDGKVDVVQFGDYAVTKEDYDAAVSVAGKGAYRDKTVQDILGLPKDTDLSSGKQRSVQIDMTEKYSSSRKTTDTVTIDGQYTYKKDFYESAVNAAGKGEYSGKTVQDILGISNDVDVSEDNITHKRYYNSDIGKGKEIELANDDSSNASKYHISSMHHETKVAREEAKKTAENK